MTRTKVLIFIFALLAVVSAFASVVPTFPDLKIKTRTTLGLQTAQLTTWYFKGTRQRIEHRADLVRPIHNPFMGPTIFQCDQNAMYRLNDEAKTYVVSYSHPDRESKPKRRFRRLPPPEQPSTGPEVVVTIDSVDTGERRTMGPLAARHVKTTVVVEPGKDAITPASRAEVDGWYLDLPGFGCRAEVPEAVPQTAIMALRPSGGHDHSVIKRFGNAPRGFVVEETARIQQSGNLVINKVELVEFSDQPLDGSLFDVPADYIETPRTQPRMIRNLPLNQPRP